MLSFLEPAIGPVLFTGLIALVLWQLGHWDLVMAILNQTWENLWSADTTQSEIRATKLTERARLVDEKKRLVLAQSRDALVLIDEQLRELDFWLTKDFFSSLHPRRDLVSIHSTIEQVNAEVNGHLEVKSN